MGRFQVFLCAVLISCTCITAEKKLPSVKTMREWSYIVSASLKPVLSSAVNVTILQESYYKLSKNVKIRNLDGGKLLQSMADRMAANLAKKKEALQNLVSAAEESFSQYEYNPMLQLHEVDFLNMKDSRWNHSLLEYSSAFKQNVTKTSSGVQVPLEIYEGWMGPRYRVMWWQDPEILNGVKWTAALDKVFKANAEKDPTLRWQYFGSQSGYMRLYPAIRWPVQSNYPDLFDVRRRPWYIQAAASPKDMVVLIDTSGSVHGQTFDIEKAAVKALLNTLGENDYVNVAWFNSDVGWVAPCLSTLVQANSQNKKVLFEGIEELQEGNLTSYTKALSFAFDAFREFEEQRQRWDGSECHKVIILFSDGGTEWPQEAFEDYWTDPMLQSIRIFTIAVGPHPIPTVTLKTMACNTTGFHSTISAFGAVRSKIQDYVKVLSIPLVLSGNNQLYHWSNFYQDTVGLGMMTTVTLPVFSHRAKSETQSNHTLLGVMGVDVPVSALVDLTPWESMGSHGYSFAIDSNGYVVFHPQIHQHHIYVEDPPDIDFVHVESSSPEFKELRKNMIDRKKGTVLLSSHLILDSKYVLPLKLKYHYTPVRESTFSLALVMPENQTKLEVQREDNSVGLDRVNAKATLLPQWKFCKGEAVQGPMTQAVYNLSQYIKTSYDKCDKHLVQQLLWDQRAVQPVLKSWNTATPDYVRSQFIATDGGLTLIHPPKAVPLYKNWDNVYNNSVFRIASVTPDTVFMGAQLLNEERQSSVLIAQRVMINVEGKSFTPAVIGAQMKASYLGEVFRNASPAVNHDHWDCRDVYQLVCYLVDSGGFIVAGNTRDIKAGTFLGKQDRQLMLGLLNQSVYTPVMRYDFQATCTPARRGVNRASPSLFGLPHWMSHFHPSVFMDVSSLLSTLRTYVYSLVLWALPTTTEARLEFDLGASPETASKPCVTKSSRYHYGRSVSHGRVGGPWTYSCGECARWFSTARVFSTNLLYVVAELPCDCREPLEDVVQDAQEDEGPEYCGVPSLYRKRPDVCYTRHDLEDPTNCVSGSATSLWAYALWLLQLLPLVLLCRFLKE